MRKQKSNLIAYGKIPEIGNYSKNIPFRTRTGASYSFILTIPNNTSIPIEYKQKLQLQAISYHHKNENINEHFPVKTCCIALDVCKTQYIYVTQTPIVFRATNPCGVDCRMYSNTTHILKTKNCTYIIYIYFCHVYAGLTSHYYFKHTDCPHYTHSYTYTEC